MFPDQTAPTSVYLVHPSLWESVSDFLHRNPTRKLPAPVLAFVLRHLFLALDFLHTECQIIHTDIRADNNTFAIEDDTVFTAFEEEERLNPSPRKTTDGRTIYLSRELQIPKAWGAPVLCDLGSAVIGDVEHTEDVQPDIYRAPEVIIEAPWSYQIGIWAFFEGGHLFTGHDPEHQTSRSREHLAEMIALLGPPPQMLLQSNRSCTKFFTDTGEFRAGFALPDSSSLEEREISLEGDSREKFLALIRKMLHWEASKRSSAKELADDGWIKENI